MKTKLDKFINETNAAIVAADAVLDQIANDRQALQERAKQVEQDLIKLQQAQQEAFREKIEHKAALAAYQRVVDSSG